MTLQSYHQSEIAVEAVSVSDVVDADGHVMEPATLWLDNIDPAARDLAIRVKRDPTDGDKLVVDGRVCSFPPRLGGIVARPTETTRDWNTLPRQGHYASYMDSLLPPSYDPYARLRWLDEQGMDSTILFPSIGLIWPRLCSGHMLALRANTEAYNRWIESFAATDRRRLHPVAQSVALPDGVGSCSTDIDDLARRGFRAVMLPVTDPADGSPYSPRFDAFWSAVAANEMVVCLHKAAVPTLVRLQVGAPIGVEGTRSLFNHALETLAGQLNLIAILDACLPDRFPGLRFAFMEFGAGWVAPVLDRTTESWKTVERRGESVPARLPWEYVLQSDRFFFNCGPYEDISRMRSLSDVLLLASDYPHPGYSTQCLTDWRVIVAPLTPSGQRLVVGLNARRMLRS